MSEHRQILASVPLFSGLEAHEIEELIDTLHVKEFTPGEQLFMAGDPGGAMMIVLDGAVEFFVFDEAGNRLPLSTTNAGGFFGEVSMFGDTQRSANAAALVQTQIGVLERDVMEAFLHKHPVVAINIITMLSKRLRDSTTRMAKKEYNAYDLLQERLRARSSKSIMPSEQAR